MREEDGHNTKDGVGEHWPQSLGQLGQQGHTQRVIDKFYTFTFKFLVLKEVSRPTNYQNILDKP